MKIKLDIYWENEGEREENVKGSFNGELKSWDEVDQLIAYFKENYNYKEKDQKGDSSSK